MTTSLAIMLLLYAPPLEPLINPTVSTPTIVGVGERPPFGSGVFKASVLVLGRNDQGHVAAYYLTYFGADQVLPRLGSRCTFTHSLQRLEVVGGLEIAPFMTGEEFETFECGPPVEDGGAVGKLGEAWLR